MNLVSGKVMVFGTFDVFHPGHRFFIEQAMGKVRKERKDCKEYKDIFIIVVSRDSTVKRLKGVLRNPEHGRKNVLEQAFPDATVVLGDEKDPMKVVRKYCPSIVCLGYDQIGFSDRLMNEFPEIAVERMKAHKPEIYKSSKM